MGANLAILDISPGVEDGWVVHNLDVPRHQLDGEMELRVLSQISHSPTRRW